MHVKNSTIFGGKKIILRGTPRAVTPFGGLSVFFEFLHGIGFAERVRQWMPFKLNSPNAIEPSETLTGFLVSVLVGARRFAQAGLLRADRALHAMMGVKRFPTDDTMRNLFKRFGMKQIQEFYEPLWGWMLNRIARREGGYSLDLDSTVFERYGKQQGAKRGYNPKKRGRPSHHPILAVLAEAYFVLHGWLRSGNAGTARGVVEFLKEALAQLPHGLSIRCVRADSGFFDQKLLAFLEQRELPYIIVVKLTSVVKWMAARVREWNELDPNYAVGEFRAQLISWTVERRFVVVRERIREEKRPVGRKLLDVPGYTFRVFVTSRSEAPLEIWHDYNKRGDVEKRILELKYDLAADDFCMKEFFATEAAFRSVLMLFNLLAEFQRASGMIGYRQPATLRTLVFLCGAILGRKGHDLVLHLSEAWGGVKRRIPYLEKILIYSIPTSPKLIEGATSP